MAKIYNGRLSFNPDTGFHHEMVDGVTNVPVQLDDGTWGNEARRTLVPGKPVVTHDGGKTWRYAAAADLSHNERHHERVVVVDSTANKLMELTFEHGRTKAAKLVDKHHFEVQPDDAHFDGIRFDPDPVAATITGHTEAYK